MLAGYSVGGIGHRRGCIFTGHREPLPHYITTLARLPVHPNPFIIFTRYEYCTVPVPGYTFCVRLLLCTRTPVPGTVYAGTRLYIIPVPRTRAVLVLYIIIVYLYLVQYFCVREDSEGRGGEEDFLTGGLACWHAGILPGR